MKNIINKIKNSGNKNIVVVGDVMLDEYIFGSVSRISPEAPVPVVKEEKREWSLGGAANVALNCKHIGCDVSLVGVIGNNDLAGKKLCSILQENGISTNTLLESDQRVTTCKKRILSNSQQLLRIDSENSNVLSNEEFIEVLNKLDSSIKPNSIILVSDYAKGLISKDLLAEIVSLAKSRNCKVLVDPKGKTFSKYFGVNYLKPNFNEYLQILDFFKLSAENSIIENGEIICKKLSLDGLVVTLGEKGIQYVSESENIFVPACKKEVFDLTGAGDTVFAFLALGLAVNLPLKQNLKLANHAAAVAVSHLKTYAVSLEELIDKNIYLTEKIFSDWASLKVELDWLRSENKKIVFTNGCFDLLHSGHIHLLNKSKKFGDLLVVALNSDDSIKRLKGEGRPVKTLEERAKVMAALGSVDFVVSFSQDTPKELIEYLSPDVLVKGGDYDVQNIVGANFVISKGGKVEVVDFKEGRATSNLILAAKRISC